MEGHHQKSMTKGGKKNDAVRKNKKSPRRCRGCLRPLPSMLARLPYRSVQEAALGAALRCQADGIIIG